MAMSLPVVSWLQSFRISLRVKCVMVQKRNIIHVALRSALIVFTMRATCDGSLAN